MKIKCVTDEAGILSNTIVMAKLGLSPAAKLNITIGTTYTVYAISRFYDQIGYYICDDQYSYWPYWYSSRCFDIVSVELSKYWIVGRLYDWGLGEVDCICSFSEWVSDDEYYHRLVDGEQKAVATFNKYKKLIDDE